MADQIVMYGTSWCGDCARAKRLFDKKAVKYTFTDIDKDAKAAAFVEKTNKGSRSVPTIVFPDGSVLVEPSDSELEKKLTAAGYN
jgi:mycoredoxin